jgi:ADP-ribose pyrophosphatase
MPGARVFLAGPMLHPPLRAEVLGRRADGRAARLNGFGLMRTRGGARSHLISDPGLVAEGLLVEDLSAAEVGRIDYHEAVHGRSPQEQVVETAWGRFAARVHVSPDVPARERTPWRLEDWRDPWGPICTLAATEIMAMSGALSAQAMAARVGQVLVRAASRVRAVGQDVPVSLRRRAAAADVDVGTRTTPYARFFAVEEYNLRFRRFDGAMSPEVNRAVFVSGDAATVLPYDPWRDRVLVIEQFRPGPFARGDRNPWMLEPIAGRIDPGESPEEAVRREAMEEAGVLLGRLIPMASYYPSPAAKMEYLFSFIGIAELPDALAGRVAGVEDEAEDIRTHLIPFDRLMQLVESGEAENGPLLVSAMFLARMRERLRADA